MNDPNTSNGTANEINEKCSPAAHTWAQRGYVQVPPGTEHLRSPSVPCRMMRMKSEVCGSDLFLDTYRYEVSTKTHLHCISHKTTISSAAHNSRQSIPLPSRTKPRRNTWAREPRPLHSRPFGCCGARQPDLCLVSVAEFTGFTHSLLRKGSMSVFSTAAITETRKCFYVDRNAKTILEFSKKN